MAAIFNPEHLAARLRQLAAWHDAASRERPPFPFGAPDFLRQGAAMVEAAAAGLATMPQLSSEKIGAIAARYRLPEQVLLFAKEIERESLRAARGGELLTRDKLAAIVAGALERKPTPGDA